MSYRENKRKAVTYNDEPTLTDQSAAKDTDLNVIVNQFLVHGQAPGNSSEPMYGYDFTDYPGDLRGYIESARQVRYHHAQLPEELRSLRPEELLALTSEQIKAKLAPVETNKQETEQK